MKGAEILVKTLEGLEVDFIFGIPGDTTHFFRALRKSRIRFITTHDERAAGFAADVYARVSGKPGVVYVSRGPGATNAATGLASAFLDSSPVLLIADQVERKYFFPRTYMYVEMEKFFAPISKGVDIIRRAGDIPRLVLEAWADIQKPVKGPRCLIVPVDVFEEESEVKIPKIKAGETNSREQSETAVKAISECLAKSRRPLLVLGPGTAESAKNGALLKFVNHLSIPFFTTRLAKGAIDERHPLSYGVVFENLHFIDKISEEADAVISIGFEYHDRSRGGFWNKMKNAEHINVSHFTPSKRPPWFNPSSEYAVNMDKFLKLAVRSIPKTQAPYGFSYAPTKAHADSRKIIRSKAIDKHLLFRVIDAHLPNVLRPKDILAVDVGINKRYILKLFKAGHSPVLSIGLSSMGFGVPASVGASLAAPGANVIVVAGDGGFLASLAEIETIKRLNLPVKIIVVADGSFGVIRHSQLRDFGGTVGVDFKNPDFHLLARSFGFEYLPIYSPKDLRGLNKTLKSKKAVLAVIYQDYPLGVRHL